MRPHLGVPPPKARLDEMDAEGQERAAALLYLARHHRATWDLDAAEGFASRLLDYGGPEKEQGKALMVELQALRRQARATPRGVLLWVLLWVLLLSPCRRRWVPSREAPAAHAGPAFQPALLADATVLDMPVSPLDERSAPWPATTPRSLAEGESPDSPPYHLSNQAAGGPSSAIAPSPLASRRSPLSPAPAGLVAAAGTPASAAMMSMGGTPLTAARRGGVTPPAGGLLEFLAAAGMVGDDGDGGGSDDMAMSDDEEE